MKTRSQLIIDKRAKPLKGRVSTQAERTTPREIPKFKKGSRKYLDMKIAQ